MKVAIASIDRAAADRPKGYREDVISRGQMSKDGRFIDLPDEEYAELRRKYASDGGTNPPLPMSSTMARNLAGAAIAEVTARVARVPPVSDEEIARRLEICRACPEFRASDERCSKCGCFAHFKTRLRSQHCPIDRW